MLMLLLLTCTPVDSPEDSVPPEPPCDPTTVEPVCSCEDATLTIGDGEDLFTPLVAGQEVTIVHGPQGGWHVLASVQVANTSPYVVLEYKVHTLPELTQVSNNLYNIQLPLWIDCVGQLTDIFGYLEVSALVNGDLNTPPELLVGRDLRISMTLTDIYGRGASSTIDVVGKLDPMDEPDGDSGYEGDSEGGDSGGADSGGADSGGGDSGGADSGGVHSG
ncbi:MAG TPA: hypothetical protein PKW90_07925 [Myxococcota bacterium]|nr:hypothetical protein [Myxococcota bacterium]